MDGKKVTVDFSAPELSPLGGLTLVREYERFARCVQALNINDIELAKVELYS